MKILYILKHNPWGIGGGCYACRNYMDAFMEIFKDAEFDICICEEYLKDCAECYSDKINFIGVAPRSKSSKILSPLSGVMHRHKDEAKRLMRSNRYDYCIFDESGIAGSLVDEAKAHGIRTVVINHNYQVEYSRDNIKSGLERALILPVVERCERRSYKHCDYNIFLTEEDLQTFARVYGVSKTKSVVGGCFFNKGESIGLCERTFNKDRLKIVISGTIGNVQNLDGINYFLDDLYSHVPSDISVLIAGKNPPVSLIERIKEYPNVEIIPNPVDIDAIVRTCDIFLCPTKLGGGMKLRVMDGLKNGLPVLTHRVSARGYAVFGKKGVLCVFDDAKGFVAGLYRLIDEIRIGKLTKDEIIGLADKTFSFESAVVRLKTFLGM